MLAGGAGDSGRVLSIEDSITAAEDAVLTGTAVGILTATGMVDLLTSASGAATERCALSRFAGASSLSDTAVVATAGDVRASVSIATTTGVCSTACEPRG